MKCYMCRRAGVECADYPSNAYYQDVPGIGLVRGNGSAARGGMPRELSVKIPGGRMTTPDAAEIYRRKQEEAA